MQDWWDDVQPWLESPAARYIGLGAAAVIGLAGLLGAVRLLLRKRPEPVDPDEKLRINLSAFGNSGPPASRRLLECYNVPVRLALVVLAPLGREGQLPDETEQLALLDALAPGLQKIAKRHDTVILRWPPQLSSQGFVRRFFSCAPLPGVRGKGSRWCSVAGRCETESLSFAAAVALCADHSNQLGEIEIERPTDWLDVLRVRRETS